MAALVLPTGGQERRMDGKEDETGAAGWFTDSVFSLSSADIQLPRAPCYFGVNNSCTNFI